VFAIAGSSGLRAARSRIDVVKYGDGNAEGFWQLSGHGVEFYVPVEIVMGSGPFNV
jgi:hypothetical protein